MKHFTELVNSKIYFSKEFHVEEPQVVLTLILKSGIDVIFWFIYLCIIYTVMCHLMMEMGPEDCIVGDVVIVRTL